MTTLGFHCGSVSGRSLGLIHYIDTVLPVWDTIDTEKTV